MGRVLIDLRFNRFPLLGLTYIYYTRTHPPLLAYHVRIEDNILTCYTHPPRLYHVKIWGKWSLIVINTALVYIPSAEWLHQSQTKELQLKQIQNYFYTCFGFIKPSRSTFNTMSKLNLSKFQWKTICSPQQAVFGRTIWFSTVIDDVFTAARLESVLISLVLYGLTTT